MEVGEATLQESSVEVGWRLYNVRSRRLAGSTCRRRGLLWHPEMSHEVVEETLVILQESQYYSLLELVDAVPRWMFSGLDLVQGF